MRNGKPSWRLRVTLPDLEGVDQRALIAWLRTDLIPACLNAPFQVTLVFEPAENEPPAGLESEE